MKAYMANIINAGKLCSFYFKNTRDERSSDSSHTELIALQLTNRDGQLKPLQKADSDQSDNFMSASHKQAVTAKRRRQ